MHFGSDGKTRQTKPHHNQIQFLTIFRFESDVVCVFL